MAMLLVNNRNNFARKNLHDEVSALITGPGRTAPHLNVAAEALRVELDHESVTELTQAFRSAAQR